MHKFNISICYQSSFSGLQTIKVTFFMLFFLYVLPFLSPLSFSPLFLPVVSPRCVSPGRWSELSFFLQSSTLWQFATLLGPGKRTPPSPPKKSFFLSFPKETWHLVGSVFRGEPKWKIGTALVSPHFFSQHQAAFLGHRWRNSRFWAIYFEIRVNWMVCHHWFPLKPSTLVVSPFLDETWRDHIPYASTPKYIPVSPSICLGYTLWYRSIHQWNTLWQPFTPH